MKYLKVEWIHDFDDEPVLMYSELAEDRTEIRKVEIFPGGGYGYAYDDVVKGTTQLSETIIPTEQEISEDPQFVPEVITESQFKEIWGKAVSS